MKPGEFDAEAWTERLAQALSELAEGHENKLRKYYGLAPDMGLLFGGPEGGRHTYSPEQVWDHFAMQGRGWDWVPRQAESQPAKASQADVVGSILLAHPALAGVPDSMAGRDEFRVQGLGTGRLTSLTDLIAGLMARAAELNGDRFRAAVGELSALLAPITETGSVRVSAGPDVGCDVVLFYGLTLEEESDLADGMALVPFERVRAFVDEKLVQELAPAQTEVRGWRSVGAIVRPFQWTPSFRMPGDLGGCRVEGAGRVFPRRSDLPGTDCRGACGARPSSCRTARLHPSVCRQAVGAGASRSRVLSELVGARIRRVGRPSAIGSGSLGRGKGSLRQPENRTPSSDGSDRQPACRGAGTQWTVCG